MMIWQARILSSALIFDVGVAAATFYCWDAAAVLDSYRVGQAAVMVCCGAAVMVEIASEEVALELVDPCVVGIV